MITADEARQIRARLREYNSRLAFDVAGPRALGARREAWDEDEEDDQIARRDIQEAFTGLNVTAPRIGKARETYERALDALRVDHQGVTEVKALRRLFKRAVDEWHQSEPREPRAAMDAAMIRDMEDRFPNSMREIGRF